MTQPLFDAGLTLVDLKVPCAKPPPPEPKPFESLESYLAKLVEPDIQASVIGLIEPAKVMELRINAIVQNAIIFCIYNRFLTEQQAQCLSIRAGFSDNHAEVYLSPKMSFDPRGRGGRFVECAILGHTHND